MGFQTISLVNAKSVTFKMSLRLPKFPAYITTIMNLHYSLSAEATLPWLWKRLLLRPKLVHHCAGGWVAWNGQCTYICLNPRPVARSGLGSDHRWVTLPFLFRNLKFALLLQYHLENGLWHTLHVYMNQISSYNSKTEESNWIMLACTILYFAY